RAAGAAPILAALTVPARTSWRAREFRAGELPPALREALNPLLRAVRWAARRSSQKQRLLSAESFGLLGEPPELRAAYRDACGDDDADLAFAADALWEMGEASLLAGVRELCD